MKGLQQNTDQLKSIAVDWLEALSDALSNSDHNRIASLFQQNSHWRDVLAFTWHLTTVNGASKLSVALCQASRQAEIMAGKLQL